MNIKRFLHAVLLLNDMDSLKDLLCKISKKHTGNIMRSRLLDIRRRND